MDCSLPVKLIHPSITNQRSINSGKIIPCYNDWNSVCDIWISPILANTYSCRIVWQIHKSPDNNLIVDRHLSIPCVKVATLHSVNSWSNTSHTRRCRTHIHSVVNKKGDMTQNYTVFMLFHSKSDIGLPNLPSPASISLIIKQLIFPCIKKAQLHNFRRLNNYNNIVQLKT